MANLTTETVPVPRETVNDLQAALRFLSFARSLEENGAAMVLAVNWLTQIGKRIALND